jgi:hypothetical protein
MTDDKKHKNSSQGEIDKDQSLEANRKSRRKSIRTILAGSGVIAGAGSTMPEWKKPVINSVVLPGHAQTSPDPSPGPAPTRNPTDP